MQWVAPNMKIFHSVDEIQGKEPVQDRHGMPEAFFSGRGLSMFVAVVESGSLSAAAKRVAVTQSAVSKALSELERDAGTQLIDRSVRPIKPTRAGALLYDKARQLLTDMRNLRGAVQLISDPLLPSLRIGLVGSVMVAGPALVKALRTLAHEVRIVSGLTPELGQALIRHEFDLLITSDPMEGASDLRREELLREPFILVTPAHYPRRGADLTLEALTAELPLVRYTTRSMIGIAIERHLRRLALRIPHSLEVDHSTSLLDMVSAGLGWTITTPLCLLQGRVAPSSIAVHPLPGPHYSRMLYCASQTGDVPALSTRIRAIASVCLRERLMTAYAEIAPWVVAHLEFGDSPQVERTGAPVAQRLAG